MMFLLSLDQLGQEVTLSSITGKVVQTQVFCYVKCHLHGLTYSPANGNVYQVVQPLGCRSSLQKVGNWGWALRVTPSSLCFLGPCNQQLLHASSNSSATNNRHAGYFLGGYTFSELWMKISPPFLKLLQPGIATEARKSNGHTQVG